MDGRVRDTENLSCYGLAREAAQRDLTLLDDSTHFSAPGRRRLRTPNSRRRQLRLLRLGLVALALSFGGLALLMLHATRL